MMSDTIRAIILGIIEGVTEFLPVSSTGHLLLAERFFGLGEGAFWDSFIVLIQLGAILAIVVIYFEKLWHVALGMFSNSDDRRFVIGILLAFLPAVVVGLLGGKYIKSVLFNPWVVCFTLIVGGAILLWVDRDAGHGQGKPLNLRIRDAADQRIFLMWQLGVTPSSPAEQPPAG